MERKVEFLEKLRVASSKFETELLDIDEKRSRDRELEGGVSVCDVIAYQIGWGKLLLGWELAEKNQEILSMPDKGYKWNQLTALAHSFYDTYKNFTLAQLLGEYKKVVQEIQAMISSMSEEELFTLQKRQWAGDKWPISKWVQVNTIAPYTAARRKIRKWKNLLGHT